MVVLVVCVVVVTILGLIPLYRGSGIKVSFRVHDALVLKVTNPVLNTALGKLESLRTKEENDTILKLITSLESEVNFIQSFKNV